MTSSRLKRHSTAAPAIESAYQDQRYEMRRRRDGAAEIISSATHPSFLSFFRCECTDMPAVAWASDHLIEGVELEDDTRWVLGVQWHPEHLTKDSEPARRLFAALVIAPRI